jgi:hypothetical protein
MSSESTGNGLGFGSALFLILMTLKLTHCIDWSWWYVTAPLWIPAAMVAICGMLWVILEVKKRILYK